MEFKYIILKKEDNIVTLILNRPERLNAVNEEVFAEMNAALDEVARDPEARVFIITGAGRAFCAGADISSGESRERIMEIGNPAEQRSHLRRGPQTVIKKLHGLEIPTIAMVNGAAVGAGFDFALACDIRIGSETARFRVAFTTIGLVPGTGGAWFLPRIVGIGRAAELLFSGDFIDAKEAERIGILNRVVPPEDLEKETMALARRLAANPPLALKLDKYLMYKGLEVDLDTALEMAATAQTICLASEDHREGVAAFREKRQPVFKGR